MPPSRIHFAVADFIAELHRLAPDKTLPIKIIMPADLHEAVRREFVQYGLISIRFAQPGAVSGPQPFTFRDVTFICEGADDAATAAAANPTA